MELLVCKGVNRLGSQAAQQELQGLSGAKALDKQPNMVRLSWIYPEFCAFLIGRCLVVGTFCSLAPTVPEYSLLFWQLLQAVAS